MQAYFPVFITFCHFMVASFTVTSCDPLLGSFFYFTAAEHFAHSNALFFQEKK